MKKIFQVGEETIFYDPGPEMLKFFKDLDPLYEVQSLQPGADFIPKFQHLRKIQVEINESVFELSERKLFSLVKDQAPPITKIEEGFSHSALDLLYVLSLKNINHCRLCGWQCDVDRYSETGKCGIGTNAYHNLPFIHIAEESAINPAIVTNFGGCALRCMYCVEYGNWNANSLPPSDPVNFWKHVHDLLNQGIPINTLEFTNPTESLPGLLAILNRAPDDFRRPVVLNTHLYSSEPFYEMANLIADVWLLDLRYGNDKCAKNLSGVDHYMKYAISGFEAVVNQNAKVIVRILVLPGHVSCCHKPTIEFLSRYKDKIWVSILDQYVPESEAHVDQNLKKRPTKEEIFHVKKLVEKYGLPNIELDSMDFWKT